MRVHLPKNLSFLLLLAVLPFASDAGTTTAATCCNAGTSLANDIFQGGTGDEDFFNVTGGPPNVMLVLDNSGSMLDFPQPITFPTGASVGTCDDADFNTYADRASNTPFDAGHDFSGSGGTKSAPRWGSTSSASALFAPSSYYTYTPSATFGTTPTSVSWDTTTGYPKPLGATAAVGDACPGLSGAAWQACHDCVTGSKGYYLYRDSSGNRHASFKGSFLNGYPPKFVIARKVVKDLVAINIDAPNTTDKIRFGLTVFVQRPADWPATHDWDIGTSMSQYDGGQLLVPLGPDCDTAWNGGVAAPADFKNAHQAIIDAIDGTQNSNGTWNAPLVVFSANTPLAETLFNVGQYFSNIGTSASTGVNSAWAQYFDATASGSNYTPRWWRSSFADTAAGAINAAWTSGNGSNATRQDSFCWACQTSSVVIITDGVPLSDNNVPSGTAYATHTKLWPTGTSLQHNGDFRNWGGASATVHNFPIDCPACGNGINDGQPNRLHEVAAFMSSIDLRPDLTGSQFVTTYTISFGLDPNDNGTAISLLQRTADISGGTFMDTSSYDELSNALFSAVTDVVSRATSFSVSNTTTLQTQNAAQLFLARFRPNDRTEWEGHLFRFSLFNEFAEGCDATKPPGQQTLVACGNQTGVNPNLDGAVDASGNAKCNAFYIVDYDCDPVIEDPTSGEFLKGVFDATTHAMVQKTPRTAANPFWDAGKVLSNVGATPSSPPAAYRTASDTGTNRRKIYTLIDRDGDGKFTGADMPLVEVTAANAATIAPYLALDQTWCNNKLAAIGVSVPSGGDWRTTCAEQVIYFIRGWDVLDEDGDNCAGPGNATNAHPGTTCDTDDDCSGGTCSAGACTCAAGNNGEERNVFVKSDGTVPPESQWKLGDIFHSSPQLVDPPYTEMMCDIPIAQTQCLATIHSPTTLTKTTQTPMSPTGTDTYEAYRVANKDRQKLVLVGANDGMLHAFDAGVPDTSKSADPYTGIRPYTPGTGAELWAFIPPDLLPKLKYALDSHTYFVDGNIMVRDIWYDSNNDGKKQSTEFHTIAVLSERSGGTQFTALDVTDPLDPKFLWTNPPQCSVDQNMVGQSWTDFPPRPPPIGPVKLRAGTGVTNCGARATCPADPTNRGFEERWVVMLNGGYDPSLARGRGVWMVDAYTGEQVWRWTDVEFSTPVGSPATTMGSSTSSMWPVPGAVGMVDIGSADQALLDSDGFMDTATWGDMGGQLWVARFLDPGTFSATTKRVTNWYAARTLEEQRAAAQTMSGRSEFYRMTSNIWDADNWAMRTFAGSGNREHMMQAGGGCGPDNLLGCCQAGCNHVRITQTVTYNGGTIQNFFMCNNGNLQHDSTTYSGFDATGAMSSSCSSVSADIVLQLNCGNGGGNPPDIRAHMDCNTTTASDGSTTCTTTAKVKKGHNINPANLALPPLSRFYGIVSFASPKHSFSGSANVATFDANRFTDLTGFTGGTTNNCNGYSSCVVRNVTSATTTLSGTTFTTTGGATAADPGWFYEYGHTCPVQGGGCGTPIWYDEKTGSGANVSGSCVTWNSFRPNTSPTGGTPCQTSAATPKSYTYLADVISGAPSSDQCGYLYAGDTNVYRATSRTSIAPPLDPLRILSISPGGGRRIDMVQIEPGGSPTSHSVSQSNDPPVRPMYWLEVPRELHQCRHVDANQCQ